MSIATMMNTGLALIRRVYIMFKVCEWFINIAFKRWAPGKKQEKRQKAVNDLYDAFSLSEMEPGGFVRLETKGDLIVLMSRKKAFRWQHSTSRRYVKNWKYAARAA